MHANHLQIESFLLLMQIIFHFKIETRSVKRTWSYLFYLNGHWLVPDRPWRKLDLKYIVILKQYLILKMKSFLCCVNRRWIHHTTSCQCVWGQFFPSLSKPMVFAKWCNLLFIWLILFTHLITWITYILSHLKFRESFLKSMPCYYFSLKANLTQQYCAM